MQLAAAVALPLLLVSGVASANAVDVDVDVNVQVTPSEPAVVVAEPVLDLPPPVVRPRLLDGSRWEAGLGFQAGSFSLGALGGGQAGLRVHAGRQLGNLRLAVDYGVAKFWVSRNLYDADGFFEGWEDREGEVRRAGATARLRGVYMDSTYHAAISGYVEAGIGKQWILQKGEPEVTRRDYVLGGGLEIVGGRDRMAGVDLGVRLIVSPALDPSDPTHELSVVGHLTAMFGS